MAMLATALAVFAAICACIPEAVPVLDHFETPRRLAWAVLAVFALVLGEHRGRRGVMPINLWRDGGAWAGALALWLLLRSLPRGRPAVEVEVLSVWLLPPLLFLAGRALSERARRGVALGAVAGAAMQSLLLLVQRLGWEPLFPATVAGIDYAPGRMLGTVGYQNQAIDAVAVGAAVLAWLRPAAAWGGLAAVSAVAALAAHRSGLAGVLAAGGARLFAAPAAGMWSRRWIPLLLLLPLLVLLALAVPETRGRLSDLARTGRDHPALRTRVTMARVAWAMWRERPLVGWGAGAYARQYGRRLAAWLPSAPSHRDLQGVVLAREAHNDPLQLAAEGGLVGLLLAAGWLAAMLRLIWRRRAKAPGAAASGLSLLAYFGVAAVTSFPWHTAVAGPLAALWLGCLTREAGGKDAPTTAPSRLARVAFVPAYLLAWCLMHFFLVSWLADDRVARRRHGPPGPLSALLPRQQAAWGGVLAAEGQWQKAREALEDARLARWDITLLNNLGHVLTQQGAWEEARCVYHEWSASGIAHAHALANEAVALERLGRTREAGLLRLHKHRLWPTDSTPDELRRTVSLLLQGGELKSAAHLLEQFEARCVERAPAGWTAEWENLAGAVAWRLGDRAEARRRFTEALRREPRLESSRRNLQALESAVP